MEAKAMDMDQIKKFAGDLTVIGLLVTVIAMMLRGWLVTGREYTAVMVQNAVLREHNRSLGEQIEALKRQNASQQATLNSQQSQIDMLSRAAGPGGSVRT
mgnify:CR=1 FL=1